MSATKINGTSGANGAEQHGKSVRYDDGIPERSPEQFQEQQRQRLEGAGAVLADKAGLLGCREKPGQSFTVEQVVEISGCSRDSVLAMLRGARRDGRKEAGIKGLHYYWITPLAGRGCRNTASAKAISKPSGKTKQPAAAAAPTRPKRQAAKPHHREKAAVAEAPADTGGQPPAVRLSSAELAVLIGSLFEQQKSATTNDIQVVIEWARAVLAAQQLLASVLAGNAGLAVRDGRVVVAGAEPTAREAGTARGRFRTAG